MKNRRTLKILLILILLLIIAIAAVTAYSYDRTEKSLSLTFKEASPSFEFGSDVPVMDMVSSHEGDVTAVSGSLDTSTVGEHEASYTVSKKFILDSIVLTRDYTLTYTVTDSIDPIVLASGDGTVVARGTDFDINDYVGYGDNADPAPVLTVEGEVDTSKTGSYPLHAVITDESGNSTEWDLTVTVADSLPQYEDNLPRTQFSDFKSSYSGKDRSYGIDVSTWQGDIDFDRVSSAGCDFVIIRVGYSADGRINLDSRFEENYRKAREAGLRIGLYMYSYDNNEKDVRSAADSIIEMLGSDSLDLPIAYDWEDFGRFQDYGISFAGLNELYDAFKDELSASGYECMLYGSKNYLEKVWDDTDSRTVWLAHYASSTDYADPYILWQASSTGRIDGIDGDVDMDIMME